MFPNGREKKKERTDCFSNSWCTDHQRSALTVVPPRTPRVEGFNFDDISDILSYLEKIYERLRHIQ